MFIPLVVAFQQQPNFEPSDLVAGTGQAVTNGAIVTVHINAKNGEGKVIADTEKRGLRLIFEVTQADKVNWHRAVIGMKKGGTRRVVVDNEGNQVSVTIKLLEVRSSGAQRTHAG